jgi:nitronate monooxygenase
VKNSIQRIYTGRALGNACGRKWQNREQVLEAEVHAERARYAAAAAAGDFDTAVVYTGEAIDMIHDSESHQGTYSLSQRT